MKRMSLALAIVSFAASYSFSISSSNKSPALHEAILPQGGAHGKTAGLGLQLPFSPVSGVDSRAVSIEAPAGLDLEAVNALPLESANFLVPSPEGAHLGVHALQSVGSPADRSPIPQDTHGAHLRPHFSPASIPGAADAPDVAGVSADAGPEDGGGHGTLHILRAIAVSAAHLWDGGPSEAVKKAARFADKPIRDVKQDPPFTGFPRAVEMVGLNTVALAGEDHLIRIFNFRTQMIEGVLAGHLGGVRRLVRDPRGAYLFSTDDNGEVLRWDLKDTGKLPVVYRSADGNAMRALIASDRLVVGAGQHGTVEFWNAEGIPLPSVDVGSVVHDLVFGLKERVVYAATEHGGIARISIAKGEVTHWPPVGDGSKAARSLAVISVEGREILVSSDESGLLASRDTLTGKVLHTLQLDSGWVRTLAVDPDHPGQIVAGNINGVVQRFFIDDGGGIRPGEVLVKHGDVVFSVATGHEGRVASAGRDMKVGLVQPPKGSSALRGEGGPVHAIDILPGSSVMVGTDHLGRFNEWSLSNPNQTKPILKIVGHATTSRTVTVSGQGVIATGGDEGRIIVRVPGNDAVTFEDSELPMAAVRMIAFGWGDAILGSAGDDGILRFWHALEGRVLGRFQFPKSMDVIHALDFHPSAPRLALGGRDGLLWVMSDILGDEPTFVVGEKRHSNYIRFVKHDPVGNWIATGGRDRRIWISDARTAEPLFELTDDFGTAHHDDVYWLDWHPEGSLIASASDDKTIKIWDVSQRRLIRTHKGIGPFYTVRFIENGAYYVAIDEGQRYRMWRTSDGQEMTPTLH